MQRVRITILMQSGEDIEEAPATWERVLRRCNVIAPDDVVEKVTIEETPGVLPDQGGTR